MALSRKFLAAKGLEADVIEEIIQAHTETVNGLKDRIDDAEKYKADADKLIEVQKELDELKAEAEKNKDKDYDKLKKEFDEYKSDIENKQVRSKKEEAYKEILKDAGIPEKHFAKILKYSDVDNVELDADGKITTAKDILESIKEEWGDHMEKSGKKGADVTKPPKNTGGSALTKEQIMEIKDTTERQAKLKEYLEQTEGE